MVNQLTSFESDAQSLQLQQSKSMTFITYTFNVPY